MELTPQAEAGAAFCALPPVPPKAGAGTDEGVFTPPLDTVDAAEAGVATGGTSGDGDAAGAKASGLAAGVWDEV